MRVLVLVLTKQTEIDSKIILRPARRAVVCAQSTIEHYIILFFGGKPKQYKLHFTGILLISSVHDGKAMHVLSMYIIFLCRHRLFPTGQILPHKNGLKWTQTRFK